MDIHAARYSIQKPGLPVYCCIPGNPGLFWKPSITEYKLHFQSVVLTNVENQHKPDSRGSPDCIYDIGQFREMKITVTVFYISTACATVIPHA